MISSEILKFQDIVWQYYDAHGRHELPWRRSEPDGSFDPYKIVVSELMLQQTQVGRVIPKFEAFLERFPSFAALATAPLSDVLVLWSGLGYNRRAKFLWQLAQTVVNQLGGNLPEDRSALIRLPGIGPNTAGAIRVYAYNQPDIFIETNIRTVFFHHFFADQTDIPDTALLPVLKQTMPATNPREWYWALMDYGAHLKATHGAQLHKVKNYRKQSRFEGSRRQVRGKILRLLVAGPHRTDELSALIADNRVPNVIAELAAEGLIAPHTLGWQLKQ